MPGSPVTPRFAACAACVLSPALFELPAVEDAAHHPRERLRLRKPRAGRCGVGRAPAWIRVWPFVHPDTRACSTSMLPYLQGASSGWPEHRRLAAARSPRCCSARSSPGTTWWRDATSTGARPRCCASKPRRWGIEVSFADAAAGRCYGCRLHAGHAGDLRRGHHQPPRAAGGSARARRGGATPRARAPGGQHLRLARAAPPARARRHPGAPQRDQVPLGPRRLTAGCWPAPPARSRGAAGGGADRARPGAVRRLAHPPRRPDAGAPHGAALGQCAGPRPVPPRAPRSVRPLSGATRPRPARPRPHAAPGGVRRGARLRAAGGRRGGRPVLRGDPLVEFAPSFGDVTTTWSYPARTSHRPLSADEQCKLGIDPDSSGCPSDRRVEDLRNALAAALDAAGD